MQDKRFYPYLFLHAGIVTLWVILDQRRSCGGYPDQTAPEP